MDEPTIPGSVTGCQAEDDAGLSSVAERAGPRVPRRVPLLFVQLRRLRERGHRLSRSACEAEHVCEVAEHVRPCVQEVGGLAEPYGLTRQRLGASMSPCRTRIFAREIRQSIWEKTSSVAAASSLALLNRPAPS